MPDIVDPTKQQPGQPPTIVAPVQTLTPDVTVNTPAAPPAPPVGGATTSQAAPPAPPAPPGPVTVGEDGEIPADAELITLNKGALKSRLARHTRAELKERFGTDNPDDIKAQLEELKAFKAAQEEQRLASLSELEREREARAKAEAKAKEWEDQYTELRNTQVVRREHSRVEGIAGKHVDPAMMEFGLLKFTSYLQTKTDDEVNALTDADIDRWFAEKVKEIPKMAKDYAPPAPPTPTQPLTNGPTASTQAPPVAPVQPPNYSPSAPNAMSAHEARKRAAEEGYRY